MKVCPDCDRQYGEEVEFCAQDGSRLREVDEASEDPLIGRLLDGRWRVREKIGEGGMGSIYRASQQSVDREVAIKTLRTALSENEEFAERFMREAQVTSAINHPHCVTIFDFGQAENGMLYLVMELLEGEPLADRLDRQRPDLRTSLTIGSQVASALAAAHERDVVHRDLKPDNIFLLEVTDGSTFTKVLDFGISKDLGSDDNLTKTGQLFGTPQYMSPEQAQGEDLDGRSDLYSLGCILYEFASGRPPFVGDRAMEILVAHVQRDLEPASEAADREIPGAFADVIDRLLEKDRDDRPASAEEVRAELDEIFENLVGSSGGVASLSGAGASASPSEGPGGAEQQGADDIARAPTLDGVDEEQQTPAAETPQPPAEQPAAETPQPPAEQPAAETPQPSADQSAQRAQPPTGATRERRSAQQGISVGGLVAAAIVLSALIAGLVALGIVYFSAAEDNGGGKGSARAAGAADGAAAAGTTTEGAGMAGSEVDSTSDAGADRSGDTDGGVDSQTGRAVAATTGGGAGDDESPGTGGAADDRTGSGGAGGGDGRDDSSNSSGEPEREETRESDESGGASQDQASSNEGESASDSPGEPSQPGSGGGVRVARISASGNACKQGDVRQRVSAVRGRIGGCGGDGQLMVEWTISTGGDATRVGTLRSEVGGSVESCVLRIVRSLSFARPDGGRCYTRVTFEFGQ